MGKGKDHDFFITFLSLFATTHSSLWFMRSYLEALLLQQVMKLQKENLCKNKKEMSKLFDLLFPGTLDILHKLLVWEIETLNIWEERKYNFKISKTKEL